MDDGIFSALTAKVRSLLDYSCADDSRSDDHPADPVGTDGISAERRKRIHRKIWAEIEADADPNTSTRERIDNRHHRRTTVPTNAHDPNA